MIDPKSEQVVLKFYSGGHNAGLSGIWERWRSLYLHPRRGRPSPPDVMMTGQDCSDLLSSVLRIDVDHADDRQGLPHTA